MMTLVGQSDLQKIRQPLRLMMKGMKKMADFKFEITENIGVLSESAKGWTKEFNLVSWNARPVKYDLREWDPNHEKMGKGITLTGDEMKVLRDLINAIEL